jgi:hypothetical protein
LAQTSISDQVGITNNEITGSNGFSLSGNFAGSAGYASKTSLFAFSPSVFLKTASIIDFNFKNSRNKVDSTCPTKNYIFGFADGQAETLDFKGTTLQTIENLICYGCSQPHMLFKATKITVSNTLMKDMNTVCYGGGTCAAIDSPLSSVMKFQLKRPYTLGGVTITEMITLNNIQVLNHRGGTTGTENARVLVFERVPHSVPANELAPTQT